MGHTGRRRAVAVGVLGLAATLLTAPAPTVAHEGHDHDDPPSAVVLPTGFSDVEVISGISEATTAAFAPDGTAFVALKTGLVKSFDYDSATGEFEGNDTSTDFADLRAGVDNYWDRGLTGITVDPQFGTTGHNFVYVSYTYNRDPRDNPPVVPRWGDPAEAYDECPEPASTNPVQAGCVVMMRVSRVSAERTGLGWTMVPGSEHELLASGCFQFGSHASGDVVFGPDGKLYASAGDGASFDTNDYGQYANPCADPLDEGGALRSQDVRSTADPLGVGGSVVRLDPVTGLSPSPATADEWLVAYGQRNPWRLTFRPGTTQLWSGDVGASAWEEINRLDAATTSRTPVNRGWPCFEGSYTGSQRNPGWDVLDKPLCESLYADVAADPAAVAAPYFSYQTRGPKLTTAEDCRSSTSSVSGVAFTGTAANYPPGYRSSLYFSDYARSCVWRLGKLPNGDPDPTNVIPFVQMADTPVQLKTGPGGDVYYVDYGLDADGGVIPGAAGVHRIVYTGSNAVPTARITADRTSGLAPLTVNLSGTTSTDPDGDTLTYAWDLDDDGAYDDSTSPTPSRTFAAGRRTVGLRVDDGQGHTATASAEIQSGNTAPTLGTVSPASSLAWSVGDQIAFSATASDAQDGTLPPSAFSWGLAIRHCPGSVCHSHPLGSFPGAASGSFHAPDHEYPSHLLLTVSVTDSGGLTTSRDIQLDPQTVEVSFASTPAGAMVTVNSATHATPYAETFIRGSRVTVTAAQSYVDAAGGHAFAGWSDGGARSHELNAPAVATSYAATYTATTTATNTAPTMTSTTAYPAGEFSVGQTLGFDAVATDAEQALPDTAYSFVLERADCVVGCARQVVQQWAGVRTAQYVVAPMSYPSRLFLTATASDAQGASTARTLELVPRPAALRVDTRRRRLEIRVDGVEHKGGLTASYVVGSTVELTAPKRQRRHAVSYVFVRWSDGGARTHDVLLGADGLSVKAVYRRRR